jgi:methylphosphotriester-DNA--protein-cysteine methyltransferase
MFILSDFSFVISSVYFCWQYDGNLTHVRIERAKELLEQGVSVTEACFAVGFDSFRSFTSLFKRAQA